MFVVVYLVHVLLILSINYVNSELALPSYNLDSGDWPDGTRDEDKTVANLMDRWFIDIKDAKCKPFEYRGTKGNFNNFPSQKLCERHLNAELTQVEKLLGCKMQSTSNEHLGACSQNSQTVSKYYFDKDQGTCTQFQYNGCGGTFNRYDSDDEYKKNGGLDDNKYASVLVNDVKTKFDLPNDLDCQLTPDVKKHDPETKVIALVKEKKCVYASVDADLGRGFFETLRDCANKCFPHFHGDSSDTSEPQHKRKIEACSKETPHQDAMTNQSTDDSIVRYYYKKTAKKCLRFETGPLPNSSPIFDKAKNSFPTLDLCHSYCGTEFYPDEIKTEKTCQLEKEGEVSSSTYKVKRYYYKEERNGQVKKCKTFYYGGIGGNTNNFKTLDECKAVCGNNMRPNENIEEDTGDTNAK